MIVMGSQTQAGAVLHIIQGPESEFHADMFGLNCVEITALIRQFSQSERVMISLTRTGSEESLSEEMEYRKVPHVWTLAGNTKTTPQGDQPTTDAPPAVKSRCGYCGRPDVDLLPVKGFRICESCAVIELGRNKQADDIKIRDTAEES